MYYQFGDYCIMHNDATMFFSVMLSIKIFLYNIKYTDTVVEHLFTPHVLVFFGLEGIIFEILS